MPLILKHEPDVEFGKMADIFIAAFDRPSYQAGFEEKHSPAVRERTEGEAVGDTRDERVGEWSEKRPVTVGETAGKTAGVILSLLRKNPHLTRDDLSKRTGLSVRDVEWNLAKMKKEGLVKRIGPAKGGHWEVLK